LGIFDTFFNKSITSAERLMKRETSHFISHKGLVHSKTVALKNARFADIDNGRFFGPEVSVIIRDGKIIAMPGLPGEPSDIIPDATLDLQGKTVLPGLFNVHCHIQMVNPTLFSSFKTLTDKKRYHDAQVEKNMADCLAHGVTNIRDAYTDDLRPNRFLIDRIRRGDIPGPRIQQAVVVGALGGYLSPDLRGLKKKLLGLMGLGDFNYESRYSGVVAFPMDAGDQVVRDAVKKAADERGADLIKVGESLEVSLLNSDPLIMTSGQLESITRQAVNLNLQTTIHSVSVETFRRAVKAGFSSLAHMAHDGDLSREDIDACLTAETIIEPTLSVGFDMSWKIRGNEFAECPDMDAMTQLREEYRDSLAAEFWLPELRNHVLEGFRKADQGRYKMLGLLDLSKLLLHFCPLIHFGMNNTRQLLASGVPMACGNDGGIQSCTPAMVAHELEIFNRFMKQNDMSLFSPAAALRTATINSARSMGIDHRFGVIQTGKTADLVIIEGNPFKDPRVIGKRVDALIMDGELRIDNCALDTDNIWSS